MEKPTPKKLDELVQSTRELDERRGTYPLHNKLGKSDKKPKTNQQRDLREASRQPARSQYATPDEKARIQAHRAKKTTHAPTTVADLIAHDLEPGRRPSGMDEDSEQAIVKLIMSRLQDNAEIRGTTESSFGVPKQHAKRAAKRNKK